MPKKPVRIAFLTSIRDIGGDDRVGQMVETEKGSKYMEGVIEHTIRHSLPGGGLHGIAQVVLIATDDQPKDLAPFGYSVHPVCDVLSRQWILPPQMHCDTRGTPAHALVHNLPSFFRSIPKTDPDRAAAKRAYELMVRDLMRQHDADILVSDHYMAKIEYLIGEFKLGGKVLNIHPAVTHQDSPFCFRGKSPTADALRLAQSGAKTMTGATLHYVNETFDDGPIIEWAASTPVYKCDTPQALRYRNYQKAKLPVFIRGIHKYAHEAH